jgi:prepilin-type N-terminal cleavage/methylation domain-containing protein
MRRAPRAPRGARIARRGMTLVEVMIALVIMAGAMFSLAKFTADFTRVTAASRNKTNSLEIALARLDSARSTTPYTALSGLAETNKAVPGFPGFTRTTIVKQDGSITSDHDLTTITVEVTPPVGTVVRKTTVIGFF